PPAHVLVSHQEAPALRGPEEAAGQQPAAEEDGVLAIASPRPRHPRPTRRLAQRDQRREGACRQSAVPGGDQRVCRRLVLDPAVLVELVETAAVARERTSLAGRAPPRV